jgi:hypothetical protein
MCIECKAKFCLINPYEPPHSGYHVPVCIAGLINEEVLQYGKLIAV